MVNRGEEKVKVHMNFVPRSTVHTLFYDMASPASAVMLLAALRVIEK